MSQPSSPSSSEQPAAKVTPIHEGFASSASLIDGDTYSIEISLPDDHTFSKVPEDRFTTSLLFGALNTVVKWDSKTFRFSFKTSDKNLAERFAANVMVLCQNSHFVSTKFKEMQTSMRVLALAMRTAARTPVDSIDNLGMTLALNLSALKVTNDSMPEETKESEADSLNDTIPCDTVPITRKDELKEVQTAYADCENKFFMLTKLYKNQASAMVQYKAHRILTPQNMYRISQAVLTASNRMIEAYKEKVGAPMNFGDSIYKLERHSDLMENIIRNPLGLYSDMIELAAAAMNEPDYFDDDD